MQEPYFIINKKLNAFIHKFHQNRLIRGIILFFATIAIAIIAISLLEHYGRFGTQTRTFMFWFFLFLTCFIFFFLVLIPALKLFKLGFGISDSEAAKIIGKHFPEVSDKLLNIIQLKNQETENIELIEACINQKSSEIKTTPFVGAVNFYENKKFIKYLLVPVFIFAGLYASDREDLLTESSSRIIDYNTVYIPPPPFDFIILNESLEVVQHQGFKLSVRLEGEKIPTDAHLEVGGLRIKMKKLSGHVFEHEFKRVQKSKTFKIIAGGMYSEEFRLSALPAPNLSHFELEINYPAYTRKNNKKLKNIGEVQVPEGTRATWTFFTENVDSIDVFWGTTAIRAEHKNKNKFSFVRTAKTSKRYTILPFNNQVSSKDSISYYFDVIKDCFPTVDVKELTDSSKTNARYFNGQIKDDYGFNKFLFVLKNVDTNWDTIVPIQINKELNQESFFFLFDFSDLNVGDGDLLEYYFEVYDNDEINGSKKSQSRVFEFKTPSLEEIREEQIEKTSEIKEQMIQSVNLAKELQREFEELRLKLLSKDELTWEDKQKAKEVFEKQKKLEKNINEVTQKNRQKNDLSKSANEQNRRITEKQKQLQELMEELKTPEMEELMKGLGELMEEMKTEEWLDKIEKLQMNNEDIEKELDRNLEMLKRYEFEESLDESLEKLQKLIKEQQKLKKDNEEKTQAQQKITEEQKRIKEEFKKLSKKIDQLHEKNEELEKKQNLGETKSTQEEIQEKLSESEDSSNKNKRKKSLKDQQEALDKMQELQAKLQKAQSQEKESGPAEDMNALRQILENLIDLSLSEEDLLKQLAETNKNDPTYVSLILQQNKLSDDSRVLEDSLYALSKRQVQVKATINREMRSISSNFTKSLDNMAERQTEKALTQQQLIMTSANNLALMLSDVLQAMQEDQANKTPGEQQCDKPGSSSSPSPSDLKKMQKELKKRLEQMKSGGKKEGGKKKEKNKGLAKMMARQELIRQQLERVFKQLEESESGSNEGLKDAINKMEETEQDIANDKITQETINRQNQIIEHLLEAEKAEQEREKEKKREAKEAEQLPHYVQELIEQYKANKNKQAELLNTLPPKLKPFYKEKVKEYFQKMEN